MSTGILTLDSNTHQRAKGERPAWHRLDTEADVPDLIGQPSRLEPVVRRPLFIQYTREGKPIKQEGLVAFVRRDSHALCDIAGKDRLKFQDDELKQAVWEALDSAGVHPRLVYEGTLDNQQTSFFRFRIDEFAKSVSGRKLLGQLTCIDSKSSKQQFEAIDHITDTVCYNTIAIARGETQNIRVRIKRTKNAGVKFLDFLKTIEAVYETFTSYVSKIKDMASIPMTMEQAEKILIGFEHQGKSKELTTRTLNKVAEELRLFKQGKGNNGETMLDLYNGVTEFYSKGDGSGKTTQPTQKWYSSEFGGAMDKKVQFYESFLSDEMLDSLAEKGEALLKENEVDSKAREVAELNVASIVDDFDL